METFCRGDVLCGDVLYVRHVRGGEKGKRRILIGQSVPPTPFGMAFGRLKLSPLYRYSSINNLINKF
jgi:hypothetical protein